MKKIKVVKFVDDEIEVDFRISSKDKTILVNYSNEIIKLLENT